MQKQAGEKKDRGEGRVKAVLCNDMIIKHISRRKLCQIIQVNEIFKMKQNI